MILDPDPWDQIPDSFSRIHTHVSLLAPLANCTISCDATTQTPQNSPRAAPRTRIGRSCAMGLWVIRQRRLPAPFGKSRSRRRAHSANYASGRFCVDPSAPVAARCPTPPDGHYAAVTSVMDTVPPGRAARRTDGRRRQTAGDRRLAGYAQTAGYARHGRRADVDRSGRETGRYVDWKL